jgi:hypothetical protein
VAPSGSLKKKPAPKGRQVKTGRYHVEVTCGHSLWEDCEQPKKPARGPVSGVRRERHHSRQTFIRIYAYCTSNIQQSRYAPFAYLGLRGMHTARSFPSRFPSAAATGKKKAGPKASQV